jgi:thiosulfate/3-mercaptopyruvate sulfurtransferase
MSDTSSEKSLPSRWLVSTEWLAANIDRSDLVVIDASYYLPTQQRDAAAEYRAAHIPGAVFFDIEAVADHSTGLPHMLPTPEDFSRAAENRPVQS